MAVSRNTEAETTAAETANKYPILRATWEILRLKLAGLAMLGVFALVITAALTMFSGGFTTHKPVTIEVPRSGLVLDPEAKVEFRGIEIGRVDEIDTASDGVRLRLELDPDLMRLVPANAGVDIRSTTVFGAKYVNFVEPAQPSGTLRPGAVLRGESVTVEFNTLFQHLTEVLAMIEPAELNATLTAIGTALQGRGTELGDLLARSDTYLRDINPSLPALRRDLQTGAQVTNLYTDTAPGLLRTVDNATVTSAAIIDNPENLDNLLLNTIGLAETTGAVLHDSEQPLITALDLLRPTSELLYDYRTGIDCTIRGLAKAMPLAEDLVGGRRPGASFNASFMYGAEAYKYPEDLAKVNATGGPDCTGVLDRTPGSHADYVVTDTAEVTPFVPSTRIHQNHPTVFQLLFAGLPGVPSP